MNTNSIRIKRSEIILRPDQTRVLLRPFSPGGPERFARIIARIMALPEDQVGPLLDEVSAEFSQRHQQIRKLFRERFKRFCRFRTPVGTTFNDVFYKYWLQQHPPRP